MVHLDVAETKAGCVIYDSTTKPKNITFRHIYHQNVTHHQKLTLWKVPCAISHMHHLPQVRLRLCFPQSKVDLATEENCDTASYSRAA